MPLSSGDRLGHYEITAAIGAGGMGEVYRARDTRLGRDVAIKTLPEALAADPDRLARLEREARALAALNHPNIATIHGIEDHHGVRALVMELVEGRTLAEVVQQPPRARPQHEALGIARQIAEALDAAHERGIVHRDLKPANIKVTSDHVVKVLDFGLAKAVAGDSPGPDLSHVSTATWLGTREGVVVGTPAYMSPEQARGQPVDKRTDIWAFGCVVYEMLAGRPAFFGAGALDTVTAVLTAEPDWAALPDDVALVVRRLIERCLEKNPKHRLRDIGDARHEIEAAMADLSRPAGRPPDAAPLPTSGVSRRKILTGGAALGLLGAGFLGGVGVTGPGRRTPTLAYQRLTYRRGLIRTARFGPDYRTILYGALWDGDVCRTYAVRPESPESGPMNNLPPCMPLAVSASGELALALGTHRRGIMTYGTLARVPLTGGAPRELLENVKYADWSPDGAELAVVRRSGGREQLEFPIGAVVAEPTSAVGGFSFPRVSPNGDLVAFFDLRSAAGLAGRVVIVNRSGARMTVSPDFFNVFGLSWRGSEVWFTAADELPLFRNAIHAMTVDGAVRVVARLPGNASLHDIAPDGRALIARTDDRSGISVLAPGDALERDLSWLDAPSLADITPDGRLILFSETGVGGGPRLSVYLRGTDGSQAVRLGDGRALALSPDASRAIVRTAGAPHAELLPTGPGQARRLERPGLTFLDARWLRDGRRVVVRAQDPSRAARLYLLDADGDAFEPVTPEGVAVDPSWALSPDGSMLALRTVNSIEIHPVARAGAPRLVPGTSGSDRLVGWIEEGLLVSNNPAESGAVVRTDPVTGRRAVWKNIAVRDSTGIMNVNMGSLVVTPDGRSYGYNWHRAISDLYIVEGWA
jgi:dipeptidyl aminopeptidase/acylaminoacyl peptidase